MQRRKGIEMGNLEDHARKELEIAGMFDEDSDYGGMIADAVLQLVKVFAGQGHSGMSASVTLSVFKKVASFEPLSPLTGNDDEWNEIGEDRFQNKRCSHVFKDGDRAYDIRGKVFREPNGACFTSGESHIDVEFPYTPHQEVVDV